MSAFKRIAFLLLLVQSAPVQAAEAASTRKGPAAKSEIEASDLSKAPKLVKAAVPTYPPQALAQTLEARAGTEITLIIDLDDKGQVAGAAVIDPKEPTGLGFEDAAVTAAYQLLSVPHQRRSQGRRGHSRHLLCRARFLQSFRRQAACPAL